MNVEKGTVLGVSEMAGMLKVRPDDTHKGTMGHALLVAGSPGMAGCAILAAEACLRSGAGKLTIHTQEANRAILQTGIPEACLFVETEHRSDSLALPNSPDIKSVGIGPGIRAGVIQALLLNTYATKKRFKPLPFVLDADALTLMADKKWLMTGFEGRAVLTPHIGEMTALAKGFDLERDDMMQAAAELAATKDVIVVLKGHPTHILMPDGEVCVCPRGNAGMATAGSGDVLTGLITGLLAQGYTVREAALLGVWLHATAGDLAAREIGQECLLARDITRHLPGAFRELYNQKNQLNDKI